MPLCGTQLFYNWRENVQLCNMFLKPVIKHRKGANGKDERYVYFRLSESYRDSRGKVHQRMIMGLGELLELPKQSQLNKLIEVLNDMVLHHQLPLCEDTAVMDIAHKVYEELKRLNRIGEIKRMEEDRQKHIQEQPVRENNSSPVSEYVTINADSVKNLHARTIGAEQVCISTLEKLKVRDFLKSKGWKKRDIDIALVQIACRAIYPYSELRTVKVLRENSAVCEIVGIDPFAITKDDLYRSAHNLYGLHEDLEMWLYNRTRSLFAMDDKILLFDLTNTYFEGRMSDSELCRYGRSKEKRSDCPLVALGAVVNTEGMLVRSRIFEGNRADCKTLQQMIGSLEGSTTCDTHRKIVVMDAGISTKENLDWLKAHGYKYITVMRSAGVRYTTIDNTRKTVTDNKGQQIELQKVRVEGLSDTVLLVDSELKTRKEQSMYRRACQVYEEGLKAIESGIHRKGGTKKRDAVNLRLGRLKERSFGVHNDYEVTFEYDEKDITRSMSWKKKEARSQLTESSHGKYLIETNMDENEEENIWQFYNVIRMVEETFRILKTDLDIRPVYHKTDEGIKAHLHLAILAYWVVSSAQYQLKKKDIRHEWNELVRVMKTQVVVTTRATRNDGARIEIRQCTEPEEKLNQILTALDIKTPLIRRKKFVWHPKAPPQKNIHSFTGT